MTSTSQAERRSRWLLVLLVVIWGASWPVIKIGVTTVPPIWFACLRYVAGTVCLIAVVALRRELRFPSPADWKLIVVSGLLISALTFHEAVNVSLGLGVMLIAAGVLLTTTGAVPLPGSDEAVERIDRHPLQMRTVGRPDRGRSVNAFGAFCQRIDACSHLRKDPGRG